VRADLSAAEKDGKKDGSEGVVDGEKQRKTYLVSIRKTALRLERPVEDVGADVCEGKVSKSGRGGRRGLECRGGEWDGKRVGKTAYRRE
jgi:hypothetical protein